MGKLDPIKDNKSNQWLLVYCRIEVISIIVVIVNIKRVSSTIKYVGFKPIHYTINLDVVSSIIVFSGFDYEFLSIYC